MLKHWKGVGVDVDGQGRAERADDRRPSELTCRTRSDKARSSGKEAMVIDPRR